MIRFDFKVCSKCKEEKALSSFGNRKKNKDGKQSFCKSCQAEDNRRYYFKNKTKHNSYMKSWREANKELQNSLSRNWYYKNKEKNFEARNRRRALKINSIPEVLKDCPIEKIRLQNIYKLCDLMSKVTGEQHHVDHMWPLSDGGPHWSGNLQVIPAKENLAKHAKVDEQVKKTIQEALSRVKNHVHL